MGFSNFLSMPAGTVTVHSRTAHYAARPQASTVLGLESGLLPYGCFKQAGFPAVIPQV